MATLINLTTAGASTTIDGAIFTDSANIGSGTGNYNTFLAIKDNDGNEVGFNTDDAPPSTLQIRTSTRRRPTAYSCLRFRLRSSTEWRITSSASTSTRIIATLTVRSHSTRSESTRQLTAAS
jgi:hypothetical protein